VKAASIDFAARVAELICQADELILCGHSSAHAARTLGVPADMMRHWRKKTGCPEPQPEGAKLALLEIGARVRFLKPLTAPANEDHPAIIYADTGELGVVTGHGCKEGHWVKPDHAPPFGAIFGEEFEKA
jgi:hypothetical protein